MKFQRVYSFLLCGMLACGSSENVNDDMDATGPGPSILQDITWEEVRDSYGIIDTAAGLGTVSAKEVNGWQPSFENGPALQAELSRPHMAYAGNDGTIYIADKDAHAIRAVSVDGTIRTIAGTGVSGDDGDEALNAPQSRLASPNGLWLNTSNDALYVLDLDSRKIRKIQDGVMETLFTVPGLNVGRGLWVAEDESEAFVASGSILYRWTESEGVAVFANGFSSLANLAIAPDGSVYVTDRDGHRVFRIDDEGNKTLVAGTGSPMGAGDGASALELGLDEVRGIVFHPEGGYFLATHKGGQIWYIDLDGIGHLFVNGDSFDTHTGDGEHYMDPSVRISEPRGISLAPNGDMIITENDAGHIRVVESLN